MARSESQGGGLTRAFGGEEWRDCINLQDKEARTRLLDLYKEALRNRGKSNYVVSFLMFNKHDRPLYWLLFCTNNIEGLRQMKRAMWRVDDKGEFRFSDGDNPDQLDLLAKSFDDDWLAEIMEKRLAGQTHTVAKIDEFVLVETPCYKFKSALKKLELAGRATPIDPPPKRRRGDYPDPNLKMKFAEPKLF